MLINDQLAKRQQLPVSKTGPAIAGPAGHAQHQAAATWHNHFGIII